MGKKYARSLKEEKEEEEEKCLSSGFFFPKMHVSKLRIHLFLSV